LYNSNINRNVIDSGEKREIKTKSSDMTIPFSLTNIPSHSISSFQTSQSSSSSSSSSSSNTSNAEHSYLQNPSFSSYLASHLSAHGLGGKENEEEERGRVEKGGEKKSKRGKSTERRNKMKEKYGSGD
jgi:hypothetical protein